MKTSSSKTYLLTAAALLGLLALTIAAAYMNLGPFNPIVAMGISIAKAMLILMVFMQLRGGNHLVWITAAAGFFFLAILILLAMGDFVARK